MRIKSDKFIVSEKFESIQGEGKTTGYPSYFIRLTNCNLTCGCSPSYINQMKKDLIVHEAGNFVGDLHGAKKASWTCDSIPVWIKGKEMEFLDILNDWKTEGVYDDIRSGLIHIIWTGGEPTLQQQSIVNFDRFWQLHDNGGQKCNSYHEIETNGSVYIDDDLFNLLDQINCSPKLSNSGMTLGMRINDKCIKRIMDHPNYQFKFVISNEDDIFEMFETFIKPFNIPLHNVCCMPALDNPDEFNERTRFVMEMAKKYKFIGLSRMHLAAWGRTCGV